VALYPYFLPFPLARRGLEARREVAPEHPKGWHPMGQVERMSSHGHVVSRELKARVIWGPSFLGLLGDFQPLRRISPLLQFLLKLKALLFRGQP